MAALADRRWALDLVKNPTLIDQGDEAQRPPKIPTRKAAQPFHPQHLGNDGR
jgi:hypothetical protein